MNCEKTRASMRERFDAGLGPPDEVLSHLETCVECRAYHERLQGLDAALGGLPLEAPGGALLGRIKAGVAEEDERSAVTWQTAGAGMAVALAAMAVVGWFYPLPVEPRLWYGEALAWVPVVQPGEVLGQVTDFGAAMYESALNWRAWMPQFELPTPFAVSSTMLWLGVGAVVAALVGINGFQAADLQNLTNHSRR